MALMLLRQSQARECMHDTKSSRYLYSLCAPEQMELLPEQLELDSIYILRCSGAVGAVGALGAGLRELWEQLEHLEQGSGSYGSNWSRKLMSFRYTAGVRATNFE